MKKEKEGNKKKDITNIKLNIILSRIGIKWKTERAFRWSRNYEIEILLEKVNVIFFI